MVVEPSYVLELSPARKKNAVNPQMGLWKSLDKKKFCCMGFKVSLYCFWKIIDFIILFYFLFSVDRLHQKGLRNICHSGNCGVA